MAKSTTKGSGSSLSSTINRAVNKALPAPTRSEVAQKLAGTTDKKSTAYKSAMRNLQRYEKGRKPKEVTSKKITSAKRKITREKKKDFTPPPGKVTVKGVICYSSDCRKRSVTVPLSASAMKIFMEEKELDVVFEFYGVPGMYLQSGTVAISFDR